MSRSAILPVLLAALAMPAASQEFSQVRRGTLDIRVRVLGTVIADDLFRLKSTIDGRVEAVLTSTGAWMTSDQNLGLMTTKELSAVVDAKGSTQRDILEDRWQKVWKPTPIRCPETCFILKSYIRTKLWVKPKALLFEAARTLRMVGRVRPEDAHWVRDGQELAFWSVASPDKKYTTRITHYVLDIQGETVEPGGTFTMEMPPSRWFPPGTDWEGLIIPVAKKNVLMVPTGALIRHGSDVFLPVRVSTGVTTTTLTEITAGVDDNRKILVLDDAKLKDAARHRQEVDYEAVRRRQADEADALNPRAIIAPGTQPRKSNGFSEIREPGTNLGEDPYAE